MLHYQFGHAILECLSRLWYIAENDTTEKIVFLATEDSGISGLKSLYSPFFKLLGIDLKRIIYIEKPAQFRRVIVPDETIHITDRYAQYKDKYTAVHEKIMSSAEAKEAKKVYLTRSQFERHDCFNEEYFEEFYRRRGYTVIAPEQYSIADQIAYMKGAEEAACTLGSLSHLLLFARPGTRLTALLRAPIGPAVAQIIINRTKNIDFYIVDVSCNFLPCRHTSYCFLLGPSSYWKAYLDAAGEKYSDEELKLDISRYAYDYLVKWCEVASTRFGWTSGLSQLDNFDLLNSLSTVLLDKPLKREDYPNSYKAKEQALTAEVERLNASIADPDTKRFEAEIQRLEEENKSLKSEVDRFKHKIEAMRNSLAWKLTKLLKKPWYLLNGRARSKLRPILNKRLK